MEQKPTSNIIQATEPRKEIQLSPPQVKGGMPLMEALGERRSKRSFSGSGISDQQLSDLLWAANGINSHAAFRGQPGLRTAPTARNHQEIELYVFIPSGIYLYDAFNNKLVLVREGDHRASAGEQGFFAEAPLSLCIAAHFKKMEAYTEEKKQFYSAVDAGYVSQNIYLYCASEGLCTVACGRIDREVLHNLLLLDQGKAILSHPVGIE